MQTRDQRDFFRKEMLEDFQHFVRETGRYDAASVLTLSMQCAWLRKELNHAIGLNGMHSDIEGENVPGPLEKIAIEIADATLTLQNIATALDRDDE